MSESSGIGLVVMAVASIGVWTAVGVQKAHLNSQVASTKDATVTDVQPTTIDRSTGTWCTPGYVAPSTGAGGYYAAPACSTDIDVRSASVVVTSAGRYLVGGTWPGLPGDKVQLRTMRGGRVNLCRADGVCDVVQR